MNDSECERGRLDSRLPTIREQEAAKQLSKVLSGASDYTGVTLTASDAFETSEAVKPGYAMTQLLLDLLEQIGKGHTVLVSGVPDRLSPSQAAAVLGVSRQSLISIAKRGVLPLYKANRRTYLSAVDVLTLKHSRDAEKVTALDELAKHDAGYL